jgi:hypothetical protein
LTGGAPLGAGGRWHRPPPRGLPPRSGLQ